jgi:putative CocE/NonD family hydrolase
MRSAITRVGRAALFTFAIVSAGSVELAWAQSSAAAYGVAEMRNVMVPMRDGVPLATDIYLPTADGEVVRDRLPAIVTRTPYNKDGSAAVGRYYAARGYAFVAQDTRGRYRSEGTWRWMDDGPDGADALAWIGRQPWSNGRVGMIGTSYVGGTQHAVAMEGSPELTTVIPVDAVSNQGYQSVRNAGAFELRIWNWVVAMSGPNGSHAARDPNVRALLQQMADQKMTYLRNLPVRAGTTPLKLIPEYEAFIVEAMRHGTNDGLWEQNDVRGHPERYQDIPVYLVGGWYDSWAGNTTQNFEALTRTIDSPVYMIMGPWIHGQQGASAHGQVSFGPDAAIPDPLAWRLEWYDHWLKGAENSVGRSAPFATKVRIFVMGTGDETKDEHGLKNHGGYWRDENEWPLARTQYTEYYLHVGGNLSPDAPTEPSSSTSYLSDPDDPVPTIGGNTSSGGGLMLQGAWDQRGGEHVWNWPDPVPLSARNDVVVFQTPPLEQDMEVTGELEVKLWVSSDALDTDFTAKLVDVHPTSPDYPGGFDQNIADGILRARFRDSLTEEKPMEPGQIYPVTIRMYPTSNVFKRGHRIRVDIASSNFPRFDINPNTGEPLGDHRRERIATNTIHHDGAHPSHIVLPVIPSGGR